MRLEIPYRRFLSSSSWLLTEFSRDLARFNSGRPAGSFLFLPEMATLRLHDEWARFSREIILSSAADRPLTTMGITVNQAPGITSRADAISQSIRLGGRRYEPNWAIASISIQTAQNLRIQNLSAVSSALGASNSPAEDLRHVRNFFAHRSKGTADKVRALPFYSRTMRLTALDLLAGSVNGGSSRFEVWVLGLRSIGAAAIQ